MLQANAAIYARQIGDLLLRMPRPLLLLLKTNDCLRSVDLSLGAPVNTFVITARTCSRALAELDQQQRPGISTWLSSQLEMLRVSLAMQVMQVMSMWVTLQRVLLGRRGAAAGSASKLGNGGVVFDEAVLAQHRQGAEGDVVLAGNTASSAAANAA